MKLHMYHRMSGTSKICGRHELEVKGCVMEGLMYVFIANVCQVLLQGEWLDFLQTWW